jgi:hypothetical protein
VHLVRYEEIEIAVEVFLYVLGDGKSPDSAVVCLPEGAVALLAVSFVPFQIIVAYGRSVPVKNYPVAVWTIIVASF